MALRSPYLPIITLNVSGLNSPIERHRIDGWIKKNQDPCICCLQETHFSFINTYGFKVKEQKKMFHANENQKKSREAILRQDKL